MRAALLGGLFLLTAPLGGCAHHDYYQAKADYHHEVAHEAWENGHPVKAAKHKAKETVDDARGL
jgi:hypothetical protein